jgi:hypothetical protein
VKLLQALSGSAGQALLWEQSSPEDWCSLQLQQARLSPQFHLHNRLGQIRIKE